MAGIASSFMSSIKGVLSLVNRTNSAIFPYFLPVNMIVGVLVAKKLSRAINSKIMPFTIILTTLASLFPAPFLLIGTSSIVFGEIKINTKKNDDQKE